MTWRGAITGFILLFGPAITLIFILELVVRPAMFDNFDRLFDRLFIIGIAIVSIFLMAAFIFTSDHGWKICKKLSGRSGS